MMKSLLAGAAALAMMTTNPALGTYNSSKSQKSIDSNGIESDKSQSYTSGPGGTKASSSTLVTAPDGARASSYHEEHTSAPPSDTTTTNQTTTTTVSH
jgi:hypothetical protein